MDSVFPPSESTSLPDFLFFDFACGLRRYVRNREEQSLLSRVAFVVDAFHFSGRSLDDTDCQTNCNPNSYPVLKRSDGTWLFNTSAAEQVNSWFGRFQNKVKEMNVAKYVSSSLYASIYMKMTCFLSDTISILMK